MWTIWAFNRVPSTIVCQANEHNSKDSRQPDRYTISAYLNYIPTRIKIRKEQKSLHATFVHFIVILIEKVFVVIVHLYYYYYYNLISDTQCRCLCSVHGVLSIICVSNSSSTLSIVIAMIDIHRKVEFCC